MLNVTNITVMDSTPNQHNNLAWFMPTFMAVFMTLFLLVSFALHHRRFRERYKRRELLEYYLELQVETGLRRIAAPTTSSSIRRDDMHAVDIPKSNGFTMRATRASIDAGLSIGYNRDEYHLPDNLRWKVKRAKIRHSDSGIFSFLKPQRKCSLPEAPKPVTISENIANGRTSLNPFVLHRLPPISPAQSPSSSRRSSLGDPPTCYTNANNPDYRSAIGTSVGLGDQGAILLSAKTLPVQRVGRLPDEQTPV